MGRRQKANLESTMDTHLVVYYSPIVVRQRRHSLLYTAGPGIYHSSTVFNSSSLDEYVSSSTSSFDNSRSALQFSYSIPSRPCNLSIAHDPP
ncbi:hypothetical protein M404DRAFT_271119 [Pisolithus tinctorius Marx 270]|uniref:Uncharacterized protein n=1 Tax=Pisolithus tinctorius Marx 270 TaxID=870435 RepID=A0A0C3PME7_PISTI|nr:hypothetical protein M404DRAFT_271119 [Pisolithus tinctorius Marx 270]